ncbi:MAG TPA: F0F1 ATP synthase subunit alpha, partial [Leptospiraceae bacterium]|nr:F0F1 ATP synthase subunit alpha [Leptospiraceae bacterium]
VASIFAITRGLMDKIPVNRVREFEKGLIDHLRKAHNEFLKGIREKKAVEDEKALERCIADYATSFLKDQAAEIRPH